MITFVAKTVHWISKLHNRATKYRKKFDASVTLGTCHMRPWRFTIVSYPKSECLWLSKQTSSTLELLNLESFHSIRFGESTTNKQLFKGGFIVNYQRNNCVLFETRMFCHHQLLLGDVERLHRQEKIKPIKLWTNLRHYRYIRHWLELKDVVASDIHNIFHTRRFSLLCTFCSNAVKQGPKSRVSWLR